ncbi:MAG TPA: PhzF family phenazine biosynthesis protein [Gaiellaceae bacterium]|nr:PhzF family phenazine biosynthesis protein [Gaiellaceae bacterium]
MTLRFVFCDVFTDRPLAGNQLAVFTDARELDGAVMQALAREIGFSETAFVLPPEAGGTARVRIFTPARELPFAGHPCLGTAWVLAAPLQREVVVLETGAGSVRLRLERDGSGALDFGWMEQPVPRVEPHPDPEAVLRALGVERSLLPVEVYDNGPRFTTVVLGSRDEVAALRPDLHALAELDVYASCVAGDGERWKTRMFAPSAGVAEDPATGAAAGPLAVHLCRHGLVRWGAELTIEQGVELGRPSTLHARVEGGPDAVLAVEVGGRAVVVARGEFRL